jgi:exonuclease SbcC
LKIKNKVLENQTKITSTESIIEDLKADIKEYEENKEAIENLEALIRQENKMKKDLKQKENEYNTCEAEYIHLHTVKGQIEQRLDSVKKESEEYEENKKKFAAYHLFMTCYHTSGISYEIIKKRLPKINEEIQKILTGIVDFDVFFETEEKKLNIYIQHLGYDARPLELGSGAEKSIAAMAIRLALLNISSLPKSDIFILDEPGTALDESNLEGFTRILQMIKNYFKTVLLISHMDSLKDVVDLTIDIDKVDGYAKVNQ